MKYSREFTEVFAKKPVFTKADASIFLTERGASRAYAQTFVTNLAKYGRVNRLTPGIYSFHSDPALASFAITPSYHALQEALSIHGLWEQETNTILVTPRRIRQGLRTICGGKVIVRRIDRKMFFGFESLKQGDFWVSTSDVEKTLIDIVYFKQHLNKEALAEIKKRIDLNKLRGYLKKTPKAVKKRVSKMLRLKP